ncbi:MAG: hypothetical protein AB8U25_04180 [Rickettsiales endosymbiont of Dermacentor nuttalli]
MNKYILISAPLTISYSAYYIRTNNLCNYIISGYNVGNKLCEIAETTGHFIIKNLIIEGALHHLEFLAITTVINHITARYHDNNYNSILLQASYLLYNTLSGILSTTTSPINKLVECIEIDISQLSLPLYILHLFQDCIKSSIDKYSNLSSYSLEIQNWYQNAGKGTSIEQDYNTVNDIWATIHPIYHFAEAHQQLAKNSPIQEIIGTLILSNIFYINESEKVLTGLHNLQNTLQHIYDYDGYFNHTTNNIDNIGISYNQCTEL